MNNNIKYLILGLAVLGGLSACTKQLVEEAPAPKNTHTVYFSSGTAQTKTGITVGETEVTPDWRLTVKANVNFFEIPASGPVSKGECITITRSADNLTAHFTAAFETDMSIIVNPSGGDSSEGPLKGSSDNIPTTSTGPFHYAAVVAQNVAKTNTFFVPAVQRPDANTLIDPAADFLIGYSRKPYDGLNVDDEGNSPVVDLYFDRPVVLGRIAISNFASEGEVVKNVTIKAAGLTGSTTYAGIDFKNASVTFTPDVPAEGEEAALKLAYGEEGRALTEGAFDAYFVALPGNNVTIDAIVVETDQWIYTKTVDKPITFSTTAFKNLKLDLTDVPKVAPTPEIVPKTYKKVTSATDLEVDTQYLLVYESESGSKVFKPIYDSSDNAHFTAGTTNSLPVDISNSTITSDEYEACEMTLKTGYHFYVASEKQYLYPTNSNYDSGCIGAEGTVSTSHAFTIIISSGGVAAITRESNSKDYSLCYSEYFRGSSEIAANVALYKLDDGRQPQTPSFSPAEVSYDIAGSDALVKPSLSNAFGDVTYSSSDETIATVDPSTGDVTVNKKGTVEITATAAGNSQYKPGSASYTLEITNSSITTPTWYKAEQIEDDETYLVVSHGYILKNDGSTGGVAINLGATGDSFEYEADEDVIWTAAESSGKFRLNNGGKVMRLSSSSFQIGTASGTESNNQWSLDADGLLKSGNYFLYYSTSQNKWAVSNSASDSHTGYLYASTPPLASRNLSFGEDPVTVTHDLKNGTDVVEPKLTGASEAALVGVTYAVTSDPKGVVSEIDATTGAITLAEGKTGTAEITASADKTDTFKKESVSYTLKVVDSNAPAKTYRKVTKTSDLEVGAQYLLVYESTPSVFNPILDGNTFKKDKVNVQSVTISNNAITSSDLVDNELTLMEGYYLYVGSADRYLYPQVENNTTSLQAESSPSHTLTITIQSDGIAKITSSSNTTANLCWSTNSSYFSTTYNSSAAINVCLYKEDDGSNPGGGDTPPSTGTTYYPASSIVAGQQYLIVSNGKALQNGGGSAAALDVTVTSGTIILDAPASILWTAQEDGGAFDFINNSQYLRRPSSGTTAGIGNKSGTADNNQWYYDADNQRLTVKHTSSSSGNTTTYYLRYNTSWEISTTAGNVVLYTADPGSDNP